MPASQVQWQPALVVLASALALGAFLVWWLRRRGCAAGPADPEGAPLELRDLDGRIASLLAQLRELDATAAKRTPEQLARERYALELAAAHALQARESLGAVAIAAPPATAPAKAGAARGFLWGVFSTAAVALLLVLVWQAASPRPEGGSVTGSVPVATQGAGAGAASAPDAHVAELRAALQKNPDDHDARLELARLLLLQRDLMGVWNETQQVLTRQPGHPRALAYQALVRLAMGQGDMAVAMLQQAIAADPQLLEARQNLAFVYASLGRAKEADAAVAEVVRRAPEEGERLRRALADVSRDRPQRAAAGEPGQNPHEAEPSPSGAAPAEVRAGASAAGIFGWIDADATVGARIPAGTVVFITVRSAGVEQGPPGAVKRLVCEAFPLQFELGASDSMLGQPLPERVRIDVRADSDGDPMTRPATDPAGHADGVALGRAEVRIVLR